MDRGLALRTIANLLAATLAAFAVFVPGDYWQQLVGAIATFVVLEIWTALAMSSKKMPNHRGIPESMLAQRPERPW